jgi:AcrR family transcriptional regulator
MEPIRREQIRRAAAKVISKHGFERSTIQDIAKAASVSTGTVNHYYANKAAVVMDAFTYVSEWFQASMRKEIKSDDSPEEKLRKLVYIGIFDDRPQARIGYRVWIWALSESFGSKEMTALINQRRTLFQQFLAGILIEFRKDRNFDATELRELAAECDAYMNGISIHRITGELNLDPDAVYRSLRSMAQARFG